ncbi:MAG: SDR family NAD(P)-dependent oxidoreductase [Rhodospirillaceae bacterium]|nr:SDR family NAD(P)-dependent oxidoreductase [Rhodospirillaceae bacterium]
MAGTVAVTGATGFIGRHLSRRLAEDGWTLRLLVRRPEAAAALDLPGATVVPGRLEDSASLRRLVVGADAIVHAAGLVKARSRDSFFAVNAEGTRRLVEAAAAQPGTPPLFVLLSSLAAREPRLSTYAASKRAGEAALQAAKGALRWTILRPPAVYGPGDREILPLFRAVAAGLGPMPARPTARLSILHVEDLAAAVAALLARPLPGEILEIHDGREGGYSWPELVGAAAAAVGRQPLRVSVPPLALRLAGLAVQAGAALLSRPAMLTHGKVREILHPDWVVRDSRLMQAVGWQPKIDASGGFRQTVDWYRREGWLAAGPRPAPAGRM